MDARTCPREALLKKVLPAALLKQAAQLLQLSVRHGLVVRRHLVLLQQTVEAEFGEYGSERAEPGEAWWHALLEEGRIGCDCNERPRPAAHGLEVLDFAGCH